MPLALMKPLIDAIQKLGKSLWYDVTGGSRSCGVPAGDIIKHLERICPVLGTACLGAAQVIPLPLNRRNHSLLVTYSIFSTSWRFVSSI